MNWIDIQNVLKVQKTDLKLNYLGIPIFMGKLRKSMCGPLLDKIKKRLESWKSKTLSLAGRIELVISTLSAIHLYWSTTFPTPASVLDEIDKIYRRFIWGDMEGRNKIHWVSWKECCKPKREGGLGIRRIHEWVKEGLTKNLWDIM